MKYIVIAEDANQLRVEFAKQTEKVFFSSYEDARKFINKIHAENVLPDKYTLKVEAIETLEERGEKIDRNENAN